MGGVLIYDITNPAAPVFVDYLNTREDWVLCITLNIFQNQ